MRSLRFIFVMFIAAATAAVAQNSFPVTFLQDSSHNSRVAVFDRGNLAYGSLDDIARVFTLDTYVDSKSQKFEMRTEGYTVSVTAGNPFVIVTDLQKNTNVVQLPAGVRRIARTYFAPLETFVPILDYISSEMITLDRTRRTIVVGKILP